MASYRLREVVVHPGALAFLAIALDGGRGHGDDWSLLDAWDRVVGTVMADEVSGAIAVENGHLYVHQDDVWARTPLGVLLQKVVERFLTIPDRIDRETKSFDGLGRNLLVNRASLN